MGGTTKFVIGGIDVKHIREKIAEAAQQAKANKSNIDTQILIDVLYYRLTIIRLGEEDNNAWWESSILSEVGRRNLEKFFQNTFSRQRYDIARKILVEKEKKDIQEKNVTTLFNFGYEFEHNIFTPFVKEVSKSECWNEVLKMLEDIKGQRFNGPWARDFYEIAKLPTLKIEEGKAVEIGGVTNQFYNSKETFEEAVKGFIAAYDICRPGNVVMPYYKRRMAI